MIDISRYVFETLREDEEFVLDRGQRDGDLSAILPLVFAAWRVMPFLNTYWSRIARHVRLFSLIRSHFFEH